MGAVGKEVDLQRGGGSTENIGVSMLGVSYQWGYPVLFIYKYKAMHADNVMIRKSQRL